MNAYEECVRRSFEISHRYLKSPVVKQEYLGYYDVIFTLEDGRRYLYDELIDKAYDLTRYSDISSKLSKDDIKNEMSRKLQKMLLVKHLTQKEIAERLKVSQNTISNYMRGKQIPDIAMMHELADALECDVNYLIDFKYLLIPRD